MKLHTIIIAALAAIVAAVPAPLPEADADALAQSCSCYKGQLYCCYPNGSCSSGKCG
jgi:hypothetical protein